MTITVGLVCEGPSDTPAITSFVSDALNRQGIDIRWVPIFPEPDRTRPQGGWANVLLWLKNNPSVSRVQRYFAGGLFGGMLSAERLDALVIQLDSDILQNEHFRTYVNSNYGYSIRYTNLADERADEIRNILRIGADLNSLTEGDVARHVLVASVESTETWCVAAFDSTGSSCEHLRGSDLINAFMIALERSEGRAAQDSYQNIDKDPARRQRFCLKHANGSGRIMSGCPQFARAVEQLCELAA